MTSSTIERGRTKDGTHNVYTSTHLGVSFHSVEPDEFDVEASQRQTVFSFTYPGLLVECLVLVGTLRCVARVRPSEDQFDRETVETRLW